MEIDTDPSYSVADDLIVARSTSILAVSEDLAYLESLSIELSKKGYLVTAVGSFSEAKRKLGEGMANILIIDMYISDDDPFELISPTEIASRGIEVLGLCYFDDTDKILEIQERGFTGMLPKHVGNLTTIESIIRSAAKRLYATRDSLIRRRELESAMDVALVLSMQEYTFAEKLDKCLGILLDHFGAERGSIFLLDSKLGELEIVANSRKDLVGERVSLDEVSVATWVAKNGKKLNVDDITKLKEFDFSKSEGYKKNSFLAYPIVSYKKSLGVFNITDKRSGSFTEADELALSRFLDRIAVTIDAARLAEEVKAEGSKLATANVELKKLEELKNSLVSMLVHDLKGPIGEIMANLSLLQGADLKDYEKETLVIAEAGTNNLHGMVLDILDVNKMEEGKFHVVESVFDLKKIAEEKIAQMDALLKLDGKVMDIIEKGSSFLGKGDEQIIKRVLANLVTNAVNYTAEDGKISIILEELPDKLKIGVQDEGPGVPEDYKEIIFQKFGTVEGDSKRNKYSTGLGLTFCKMAMDAHEGEIWVEDGAYGGSIFYFTLKKME